MNNLEPHFLALDDWTKLKARTFVCAGRFLTVILFQGFGVQQKVGEKAALLHF
jgi:hypothetical protein